jgi:ABC-2 type transport system ATP-binding protein
MNLLQVKDLKKSYKRGFIPKPTAVLKGLNFSVPEGTITGFLGANGAGKTTTMRCILGLDYPDSGEIELFGKPLSIESKRKLGFLPERPYFYEHLTGVELLEFYANLTSKWKKQVLRDRIDELLKRVDLDFAKNRPLRTYSKGMQQKLGVAQALIHDPELVILDEPMSGLDPDGRMALNEIIFETAKKGTAVFFTSHLLYDTERLCQRLVVIKDGISIFEGLTETLLAQSDQGVEIFFLANGVKTSRKVIENGEAQRQIKALVNSGAEITEIRRNRATLEEVFVKMALRGGRK